jgi:hypothetical protein
MFSRRSGPYVKLSGTPFDEVFNPERGEPP